MASPKNYKTHTSKKASAKKSVSRKPVKKGFSSHVGLTKLTRKSFFKPWMAIPAIILVALAGYTIIQFSHAGNLNETLPMISSTCRTVHKQSGQAARQCLTGQSIEYGISVGKGTYKVCFSATASDNSSWTLRVTKGTTGQIVDSSFTGVNKQYGITSITPCTSSIMVTGPNTKLTISLTTSKSGSSKDGAYKGVYVYGAKLSGDGSNSSSTDAVASDKQQKIDECNARPDFTKETPITGGTRQSKYGYRWEGAKGCQSYLITAALGVSCTPPGYIRQGNTCRPNPKPDPLCDNVDGQKFTTKIDGGYRITFKRNWHHDCKNGKLDSGHWGPWFEVSRTPISVKCSGNVVRRGDNCVDKVVYAKKVHCPEFYSTIIRPLYGKTEYSCMYNKDKIIISKAPTKIECYNSDYYRPTMDGRDWRYCGRKSNK